MSRSAREASVLLRQVRIVPVRSRPAGDRPVDVRITAGRVMAIAQALEPSIDELVVDGAGRYAIPGLWDQHVHMTQWARTGARLDLRATGGPDDVLRLVGEHVAALPPGGDSTVFAFGHRSATWSRPGTVAELDAVSGGHPVVLVSGDAHNGWLNSRALRHFGLDGVTGALEENDWFPVFARLEELAGAGTTAEEDLRRSVAEAATRGVVGIGDFEFGRGYLDWPAPIGLGIDQLRVRTATYADTLDDVIAAGLRTGDPLPGSGGLARMGPLKIIADGSLNTRTAFCCTPYADADQSPTPRGSMNLSASELQSLLERAHRHGLEIAVHAIGDAAMSCALDAFEATGARGSVEHAQLVADGDVGRMARLGITASVQPTHLLDDRDVIERSWPDRADRCFPWRSMLEAGTTIAFGSDAPVSPLDPWQAMAAAVSRSDDGRPAWHPQESIGAREALAASTDRQGTIAEGSRGDIVLVDSDPLQGHPDAASTARHLRGMTVAATVAAGRVTHLAI